MTVAVQPYQRPQEESSLDQLAKAVSIASTIYGVGVEKHKMDALTKQNELETQKQNAAEARQKNLDQTDWNSKFMPAKEGEKGAFRKPGPDGTYEYWRPIQFGLEEIKAENKAKADANKPPKPSAGIVKLDQKFAEELNNWNSSGQANYDKSLQKLEGAKASLEQFNNDIYAPTGRFKGNLPDWFKSDEAIRIRDDVRESAQGGLKAVLGSQYTEREGTQFMNRSYNERLPPTENIKKIDASIRQLKTNKALMDSRAEYFNNNYTLQGWSAPKIDISSDENRGGGQSPKREFKKLHELEDVRK